MALPTGTISMNDLRAELGYGNAPISLNDPLVRDLANSGLNYNGTYSTSTCSLNDVKGQQLNFYATISSGASAQYATTAAYNAGWTGRGNVTITITGTIGSLYTGYANSGNVTIINNGTILGYGGSGGNGGGGNFNIAAWNISVISGNSGGWGGTGLYCSGRSTYGRQRYIYVYNNGTIAGGGGGGGGGCAAAWGYQYSSGDAIGGGGGGGGAGLPSGNGGGLNSLGVTGSGGAYLGDRGTPGNVGGGGAGGQAGNSPSFGQLGGKGGDGGGLATAGGNGSTNTVGWSYWGTGGGAGNGIYNDAQLTWPTGTRGTIIGAIA